MAAGKLRTAMPIAAARSLFDVTPSLLRERLATWRQPAYRAMQILEWVYRHGVDTYEAMSNLPRELRARLAAELPVYESTIAGRHKSRDGTVKLLLRWPDGGTSECVLIPDGRRRTACISTQVGCSVGCVFCASGQDGLCRQLSCGRIIEQAMRVRHLCGDSPRLSNVVFMGLGEPLANYDATVRAVRTINATWGLGIGARRITVSTIGLPSRIRKLADEGLQITLALSLHAPTDELRRALIPWARRVTIASLVEAANYYFDATGREITLEYVLIDDVNDSVRHARRLGSIARRMRGNVNVNLLAYNPVEGLPYGRPARQSVERFAAALRSRHINVHVRRSRGLDIDAACGQLRRRVSEAVKTP